MIKEETFKISLFLCSNLMKTRKRWEEIWDKRKNNSIVCTSITKIIKYLHLVDHSCVYAIYLASTLIFFSMLYSLKIQFLYLLLHISNFTRSTKCVSSKSIYFRLHSNYTKCLIRRAIFPTLDSWGSHIIGDIILSWDKLWYC